MSVSTGLSARAWLAWCIFRDRGRVLTAFSDANHYATQGSKLTGTGPYTTQRRPFTSRTYADVLVELEDAGYIRREGTAYEMSHELDNGRV
jgi:hypothetical protein